MINMQWPATPLSCVRSQYYCVDKPLIMSAPTNTSRSAGLGRSPAVHISQVVFTPATSTAQSANTESWATV